MYRNRVYEKRATYKASDVYRQLKISFAILGAICGINAGFGSIKWLFIGIIFGGAVGFCGGLLSIAISKAPFKKFSALERSEGYTDAAVAEIYEVARKRPTVINKATVAAVHNDRGEFLQAVNALAGVDESKFTFSPYGAEMYYSQLMLAYLMLGRLEKAADVYNRGFYFMNTYMRSPISGCYISTALAVYEYYSGRLDNALNLILISDNAFISGDIKEEDKLPQDCVWTINCYWRALFLACKGMTDDALKVLDNTNGIYTTDYYKMAIGKLRSDIKNKTDSNRKETV
ncbi:MAG: hypothetical protein ACI4KG_07670 [Oscillospiraceae bacterium]